MTTAPPQSAPGADDGKIVGIELLRFSCALAVLVFHYQHFAFFGTAPSNFVPQSQPFYHALKLLYDNGFYGVQIFWCISGFIFFWKYGATITARGITGWKFFVLRLSRLYPLHLLTLLFVAGMQVLYFARNHVFYIYSNNDVYHFVLQLFMASNWGLQIGESFNGPIWSISVEVLVYAIFFLTLRYISGTPLTLLLMALAAALVQILKISEHPLFACLLYFYLGCLTAVVYLKVKSAPRLTVPATATALAAVAALALLSLWITIKPKYLLAILSPALIFLCVTHIRATALSCRLLVPAGNMTYSSYLLHVPIQIVVATYCSYSGATVPIYSAWFFVTYIVVTLILSEWSYRYIEMPAQTFLRRRLMGRSRAVAQSLA
jgi:peptidoglycan/LPS O-acetylase OafA/YrhL